MGSALDLIQLSSGATQLSVAPSTGKIARLSCREVNLLVEPLPGEWVQALSDENRQQFASLDAWGGDECFPTVGGSELWGLRDHGNVWGKSPSFNFAHDNQSGSGWSWGETHFKRSIKSIASSDSSGYIGAYHFQVQFNPSMPLQALSSQFHDGLNSRTIYASHALFTAEPGDLVQWGCVKNQQSLAAALEGQYVLEVFASRTFAPEGQPLASKFYVQTSPNGLFCTSLIRKKLGVRIDVLQDSSLPWVGIWWCHNGWGDGRPHSTVGIEPTNLPSDGPILDFTPSSQEPLAQAQFAWVISNHSK